jgi:endoglucanase
VITPPLSTRGRDIIDATGQAVKLCSVNWAGAHQDAMVPSGLDKLDRYTIARRIADAGFNSVRLPFALRTVTYNGLADPAKLTANPDMDGLTPWGVYQVVTEALTGAGLFVIPNCHLLFSGWCCSDADGNGLWWNGNWPASVFSQVWQTVAQRFASEPLVAGYDIKNEPRKATINGTVYTPSWGDGNRQTDFRWLYASTGDLIHQADPDALIICEGLNYASDLTAAGPRPVVLSQPGKVVYSLHEYSWFHPGGQSQADYFTQMDARAGYLVTQGTAPLWIGEWGSENAREPGQPRGSQSPSGAGQEAWFANSLAWIGARDVSWCWWLWDAGHVKGTEPVTNKLVYADGDRTSYGIAAGQDWQGTSSGVLSVLRGLM